jgi:hypothetical protein
MNTIGLRAWTREAPLSAPMALEGERRTDEIADDDDDDEDEDERERKEIVDDDDDNAMMTMRIFC